MTEPFAPLPAIAAKAATAKPAQTQTQAQTKPPKTGFEKWKDTIDAAAGDPRWDGHDCEIRAVVNEFNLHLRGQAGFVALDWQLMKAMAWVESGALHAEWSRKPMQIGVVGDPGLASFLGGKEGGDLILPPAWRKRLTTATARTLPAHNLRAGIGYLLMRLASFDFRSVDDADTRIYEVKVKPGDSLDRIAKAQGTTVEVLRKFNPDASGILRPGQVLKYRKASIRQVIISWRVASTTTIALRYNGGGDPNYAAKLEYVLPRIRARKAVACP
jgi:LysM domain